MGSVRSWRSAEQIHEVARLHHGAAIRFALGVRAERCRIHELGLIPGPAWHRSAPKVPSRTVARLQGCLGGSLAWIRHRDADEGDQVFARIEVPGRAKRLDVIKNAIPPEPVL